MILPYQKNPRASTRKAGKYIYIRSKKYTITEFLSIQIITSFDKSLYVHKNIDLLKYFASVEDLRLVKLAKSCRLTKPDDPVFKKKFRVSKYARLYKGFSLESEGFNRGYGIALKFVIFVETLDKPFLGRDAANIYDTLRFNIKQ